MNNFRNDYHDLCHPKVLENLLTLRGENNVGYCYDLHSERAIELINERLGARKPVFFVQGGTAANALAISFSLRPHEAVIAADSGHIVNDEVGAIEANGHRVITIPAEDGKLNAQLVEEKLASFGDFHNVLPGMVYLSNSTETGRVYKKKEIMDIYKVAQRYNVYVYIDGARMGAGLASEACDIKFEDYKEFCDVFSIGGTKNGALFGEALVFNDLDLSTEFNYYMKQQSSLMAKGFLLGAQFEALFTDDLFFKIGEKAQENAVKLAEKLKEVKAPFAEEPESNQIFLNVPVEKLEILERNNSFDIFAQDEKEALIRFVTTYETKEEEIDSLVEDIKSIL